MARPQNNGLKYFSLDTDFFYNDKRITSVRRKYGCDGVLFYIYLLTEIYRNSFYTRWDEDAIGDAMDNLHLSEGFIEQVMEYLCGRSLLTKVSILSGSVTIITSPGIQKRWQAAKKELKREIVVDPEMWLLEKEETAAFIKFTQNSDYPPKNLDKSPKNSDKSGKNSLKENKGKENKINEIKEKYSVEKERKIRFLLESYFEEEIEGVDISFITDTLKSFDEELIEIVFKKVRKAKGRYKDAFDTLIRYDKIGIKRADDVRGE